MSAPATTRPAPADRAEALERIHTLHAQQRFAEEFPALGALLAALAQQPTAVADLSRAGRLLARTDPDRIHAAHPEARPLNLTVSGHGTLDALTGPLTAELARHGIPLRAVHGDYDGWRRELQDTTGPLYAADTELSLVVLDAQLVFDELPQPWRVSDVADAVAATGELIEQLVERYLREASGTLVLNTLPLLPGHLRQLIDHRSRTELSLLWRQFNTQLLRIALDHPRVHVVDLDPLIAQSGPARDSRLALYTKEHLGTELLARYAREIAHLARTLRGRTKKVLVVDLDHTLWDGILGDDGPDGIAVAGTYRGEAFGAFQKVVRQLGSQGVLLGVCSKNDQEPVHRVLADHPDMVLRPQDFVRITANWQPKDGNLRDMAARLNLGTDSFVFVDDSPFECGLVTTSLPEIAVVRLDEEPALHIDRLLADGWFDVAELTEADRSRAGQYRADADRLHLLDGAASMEDYLNALDVHVTLHPATAADVPRLSQLTLRTNQFNLTTHRLDGDAVRARVDSPHHLVLTIRSADRFGDNGLVGAVFAEYGPHALHLDNVLLSCRVFARGIEQAALAALLAHAHATATPAVTAAYRPTAKNGKVRDLYPALGFATVHTGDDGALDFRHDLTRLPPPPGHVTLHATFPPAAPQR
ncbi:HAD-IIIC family phosphatase [Streptomyces indicus]|uniref:HAD-superfamily phosphatase, subfamily IIIC/FkbH-like domain-containing protein n=1 Tax=Streptomyces indicus TaxID=417292 RepID=A0A1G9J226_9ACTN|nr:HAD-IIIC family phosphatase [Streptomyces indicus]SDL31557.1 HAD-superfamily phosphatase, subfamily IIIC/FkbH-like domain-containing protein [Streptomyces indicus]